MEFFGFFGPGTSTTEPIAMKFYISISLFIYVILIFIEHIRRNKYMT